jgi:hypothetical protein
MREQLGKECGELGHLLHRQVHELLQLHHLAHLGRRAREIYAVHMSGNIYQKLSKLIPGTCIVVSEF